jgi:hypothetical protein
MSTRIIPSLAIFEIDLDEEGNIVMNLVSYDEDIELQKTTNIEENNSEEEENEFCDVD